MHGRFTDRRTTPLIMKILSNMESARQEAAVAKALGSTSTECLLVGPVQLIEFRHGSAVEVSDEWRIARAGLSMPVYASTLVRRDEGQLP